MSTQKTSPSSLVQNKEKKVAGAAAVAARLRGKGAMLAEESLLAAAAQSASPELPKGLAKEGAAEVADLDLAQDKPGVIDGQDKVELTYEQTSSSPSQTWTLAQASTSTATDASASAAPACQDSAGKACDDDDKGGAWWGADVGSWLKLGLAGGALLLASGSGSQNDDTSKLSTAMAAGPFKASGMTLAYFGTGGLLLELSWDENGVLTKTVNAALNGDVQIQTSKVMVDGQEQVVVTGVVVDFANYTGTLMAVLFDKADSVPLEFYDEVAGLISLEESALHAVTTINKGQNFLAITPFTELALRMAGVETATLVQTQEITSLLQDKAQLALVDDANKTVSQWVGVDIVSVLPVAVNDVGFVSATDLLAKNYGEKLAALARLVPGNLEGSIEKLLQSDPDAAPTLLAQALTDYKDDIQSSTTPASVEIDRSVWINMQEGARPLLIRGASADADDGSVVRITIYKDGVALLSVKAEVQGDAWQVTLPQTLSQMGVQDGDALTIRAYIDPDYPDEATTRYDATPPATPQFAPDLQAHQDSGISSLDNVTREQSPDLYVGPLPADVAAVELLVDGQPVAATYNAQNGTLRPNVSLEDGVHRISYRWIDAAGNVGLPSPKLLTTVDASLPARMLNIDISDDSGISASDFMTNVTTQTVTGQLSAPLSVGDRVWASVDGGTHWMEVTDSVNSSGRLVWNGVSLIEGESTLQLKTIDLAGNAQITTQSYRLDTTPPNITVDPIALGADTGASASDFVTRQPTQQVTGRLMEDGEPQTLLPGDRLMASADGGNTWQDITASVQGSQFTWTDVSLNGGANGANSLRFQVIDAVDNRGLITVQNYRLDTIAPVGPENFAWATYPQGISSGGNSVTGFIGDVPFTYTLTALNGSPLNLRSTDNMYNQGFFPAGYHVPGGTTIRNDDASVNTLTFDVPMNNPVLVFSSIGNPSTPVSIEFPQGVEILWSNNVTVAQGTSSAATRVTGTEGSLVVRFNGSTNEFVFKYLSPETYVNFAFGAAVFDLLSDAQDTGIKDIDDVTQVTRPDFQIHNMPSDALSAELLIDGSVVRATFDAQHNTLTPELALEDGVYNIAYRFVDLAGNVSSAGSATRITIDSTPPGAPSAAPDLVTADDNGNNSTDNKTGVTQPHFFIGALPAGTSVELLINGAVVSAHYDSESKTLQPDAALDNGDYTVSYRYVDAAGNHSAPAGTLAVRIAEMLPPLPPLTLNVAAPTVAQFYQLNYVRALGDVNNDGYADFAISAPLGVGLLASSERVIYGSANYSAGTPVSVTGMPDNKKSVLMPYSNQSPDRMMGGIAGVGDLNNDGIADAAAASAGNGSGVIAPYSVNLYFNNAPAQNTTTSKQVLGGQAVVYGRTYYDWMGGNNNFDSAGDLNGDGRDDMVIGAAGTDLLNQPGWYNGQVFAVYGSSFGSNVDLSTGSVPTGAGFKVSGTASLGTLISGVGDFNGDGYADFITMNASGTDYLIYGGATGANFSVTTMTSAQGVKLTGLTAQLQDMKAYKALAYAGDFNGDGFADTAVADAAAGKLYVLTGKTGRADIAMGSFNTSTDGYVIAGLTDDQFAYDVGYAGDINGDGLGDLIVSAAAADGGKGVAYVIYGRGGAGGEILLEDIYAGQGGFAITNDLDGGMALGFSVGGVGDANGDGLQDLLVSATYAGPNAWFDAYLLPTDSSVPRSKVTQMGTSGADTLSDDGVKASLIGGLGNDTLQATAASVLYGGAGNDTFVVGAGMAAALENPYGAGGNVGRLSRIDGGSGVDTLKLDAGVDLDLTQVANQAASLLQGGSRIDAVEIVDLSAAGANTLKLTLFDVIDMGNANTFQSTGKKQLMIKGTNDDTLNLLDQDAVNAWTLDSTVTISGVDYQLYNHATAAASLYVQTGVVIDTTLIPG